MNSYITEINLLGTGGGYGESVVIDLGNNEWMVVDSCQNPYNKTSLPLHFLISKSVDLGQVKLIVCTHWHDDHIKGLSDILDACPNATFSFARVNDKRRFLQFVSLDYEKLSRVSSNSATVEFNRCLEIQIQRKSVTRFLSTDRLIYSDRIDDNLAIEVYSLSPSDLSSELFDIELAHLITEFGPPRKKIPYQSPNNRSAVLLLRLGLYSVLLGSDLEVDANPNLGWLDITRNSRIIPITEKSGYFKIPHHGSETGYHPEIWDNILQRKPIGTTTPWNKSTKLPTDEMVSKYKKLTSNFYITSSNVGAKPKKRDKYITKTITRFNDSIQEIKFQYGVISSKIDLSKEESEWVTTCFGSAYEIK